MKPIIQTLFTLLLSVWKTNKKFIVTEGLSLVFGLLKKVIGKRKPNVPPLKKSSPARRITIQKNEPLNLGKSDRRFYKPPLSPKTYGQNVAHHRKPKTRLKNAE